MDLTGSEEIDNMKDYEFCIDVGCSATYQSNPFQDLLFIIVMALILLGVVLITAGYIEDKVKK